MVGEIIRQGVLNAGRVSVTGSFDTNAQRERSGSRYEPFKAIATVRQPPFGLPLSIVLQRFIGFYSNHYLFSFLLCRESLCIMTLFLPSVKLPPSHRGQQAAILLPLGPSLQ